MAQNWDSLAGHNNNQPQVTASCIVVGIQLTKVLYCIFSFAGMSHEQNQSAAGKWKAMFVGVCVCFQWNLDFCSYISEIYLI